VLCACGGIKKCFIGQGDLVYSGLRGLGGLGFVGVVEEESAAVGEFDILICDILACRMWRGKSKDIVVVLFICSSWHSFIIGRSWRERFSLTGPRWLLSTQGLGSKYIKQYSGPFISLSGRFDVKESLLPHEDPLCLSRPFCPSFLRVSIPDADLRDP